MRTDHGGDACVGGAQQVAPRLESPHARDLQVLVRAERDAEPAVVADIHEELGPGERLADLFAEQDLVADRGAEPPLARPDNRGGRSAGREVFPDRGDAAQDLGAHREQLA